MGPDQEASKSASSDSHLPARPHLSTCSMLRQAFRYPAPQGTFQSNRDSVHVCVCVYEKVEFSSNSALSLVLGNLTGNPFVLSGPLLKPKGHPNVLF